MSPDAGVFSITNPPSLKSKRKLQQRKEDELLTACLQELKRPRAQPNENDSDSTFGKYISNQLSKVPEGYQKEMLKLELQQCIMKVFIPAPQPVQPVFSAINSFSRESLEYTH